MHVVLVAHAIGVPVMGGDRARILLRQAFEARGAKVEVSTYESVPRGRDVYVFETPTTNSAVLDADGRATVLLRHGDCQMASLAPQLIDTPGVTLVTPTAYAYHCLGWRVERSRVQWMALEPPRYAYGEQPKTLGTKVLHVRAFDFQKDTPLAIQIAREMPGTEFVFRCQPGVRRLPVPSNVTLLPPTMDQDELWADVGCLLVTSRWESFCMAAYEAMGRGIPVVYHNSLRALSEWCVTDWLAFEEAATATAQVLLALERPLRIGRSIERIAHATHKAATEAFDRWMDVLEQEIRAWA